MREARQLTEKLRGRWHCKYGTAPCPVCQPQGRKDQNALTLTDGADGRLLLHCKKAGCAFCDILAAAGIASVWLSPPDQETLDMREAERRTEIEKKIPPSSAHMARSTADHRHCRRNLPAPSPRHHVRSAGFDPVSP